MASEIQQNHKNVEQWLPQKGSLPLNCTELEPRHKRYIQKRVQVHRNLDYAYTIMYRCPIVEEDTRSCDADDDRGLTRYAFNSAMQFIDDWVGGNYVIVDIDFLLYFNAYGFITLCEQ